MLPEGIPVLVLVFVLVVLVVVPVVVVVVVLLACLVLVGVGAPPPELGAQVGALSDASSESQGPSEPSSRRIRMLHCDRISERGN